MGNLTIEMWALIFVGGVFLFIAGALLLDYILDVRLARKEKRTLYRVTPDNDRKKRG